MQNVRSGTENLRIMSVCCQIKSVVPGIWRVNFFSKLDKCHCVRITVQKLKLVRIRCKWDRSNFLSMYLSCWYVTCELEERDTCLPMFFFTYSPTKTINCFILQSPKIATMNFHVQKYAFQFLYMNAFISKM